MQNSLHIDQGDPSLGKDSTADFHTSCKTVSIRIATINPAASLLGNFFLIILWVLNNIKRIVSVAIF
jgi:hypothetical protein